MKITTNKIIIMKTKKTMKTCLLAAVLCVVALTSCGDSDLADAMIGRWQGEFEATDDDGATSEQSLAFDFTTSDDIMDGGKFTEQRTETFTFEDEGLVMTCTATANITGEWEVLMGDLKLTYDLSSLDVTIDDIDARLSSDADDIAREAFADAQDAGMFDADDEENRQMAYEELRAQYQADNDEDTYYSDLKVEGGVLSFDTGDFGRVELHRTTD